MLSPNFTYLFLDFETTGLDLVKDDPIQIGLKMYDHTGAELSSFSSLLKPHKDIKELKTIVTYLTQKNLEDLTHAPVLSDIMDQIEPFLGANTILIGHNIAFDLSFLQRYTARSPAGMIDTFPLSKALLHFLPSYALEVITHHLFPDETTQAHDALADCAMNAKLFFFLINHIETLRHDYMILDYVWQHTKECPLLQIIKRTEKPYKFAEKDLFLPVLQRPVKGAKKIIDQPGDEAKIVLEPGNYAVGSLSLKSLLTRLDRSKHARVCCFSHRAKLQRAKTILEEGGLVTTDLNDTSIFLPELINQWLHQTTFDEGELLFLAKYVSHHQQSYTFLDINSSNDYKIFGALTTPRPPEQGQIILCTHEQRYDCTAPLTADTKILFFDSDFWYQTIGNYLQKPFDPIHFLQAIEHRAYAAGIKQNNDEAKGLAEFQQQVTLFFGVLGGELDRLFVGVNTPTQEITQIVGNTRMPHTGKSFSRLEEVATQLQEVCSEETTARLRSSLGKLSNLLHEPCVVEKVMYGGSQRYYTLHEPKHFHAYEDFLEHLPPYSHTFFSVVTKDFTVPFPPQSAGKSSLQLATPAPTSPSKLWTWLAANESITSMYILSTSKSHSQDLFQQLMAAKKDQTYLIVAEGITGSIGKIIYLAKKSSKPVIMIGGHTCFLQARAAKFAVSTLIPYYLEGKQKDIILADVLFYG